MSFKESPQPPAALQTTKALSFEEENSSSLISDSVSVDSTVTLENLPLKAGRLKTPPWSTHDTPSWSTRGRDHLSLYSINQFSRALVASKDVLEFIS